MAINYKDTFMLCESISEEEALKLDNKRFLSNIKYDGCRCIAFIKDKDVVMLNRRGNIINFHFRDVEAELKKLPDSIIDGEIISRDDNFTQLQKRAMTKKPSMLKQLEQEIPVKFMLFDILASGDKDLRAEPLSKRIEILREIFLKYGDSEAIGERKDTEPSIDTPHILELAEYKGIAELLAVAKEKGKEGIVVKDMNGIYENKRSKNWKKLKLFKEAVITFQKYEENPAGITLENSEGVRCLVAGEQSKEVKARIDLNGSVEIYIQYLGDKTENGKYRFISFRGLKE